jgi:hypothetical protein
MATPQKEPLRALTPEEQTALERLTRSSSARVDRVRRRTRAPGPPPTPRSQADLCSAGARLYRSHGAAPARSEGGRHGDLVAEHPGPHAAPRGVPAARSDTIRRVLEAAGSSYQKIRTKPRHDFLDTYVPDRWQTAAVAPRQTNTPPPEHTSM